MKRIQLFTFLILINFGKLFSQVLLNRDWVEVTGFPNMSYDFQSSDKDIDGNVIIIGNTFTPGQAENYLVTKYSKDGNQIWQVEFNGWTDLTDFGTCLTVHNTDIYVGGVSFDTIANSSSFEIVKIDKNGNIEWNDRYNYSELMNIPLAMTTDANGSLFVAGTSQIDADDYAIITLKYDKFGQRLWENVFDSLGLTDGAGGIKYYVTGNGSGRLAVSGISGSNLSNWDFLTTTLNADDGKLLDFSRIYNPNALFAKANDIVKDDLNNIYMVGSVLISPNNSNIRVLKLDSLLNIAWSYTFDGGYLKNDEASSLDIDQNGNIYVTGFVTKATNKTEGFVLKISKSGLLIWDKRKLSSFGGDVVFNKIKVDALGNSYVSGKIFTIKDFDIITQSYDSVGNLKWERLYTADNTSDNEARDLLIDKYGDIIVYGRNKLLNGTWQYVTLKYDLLNKNKEVVFGNSGIPHYLNNQLIVKFRKDIVNTSFVDNVNLEFASIQEVLKQWAFDSLKKRLPLLFSSGTTVEKIYKALKSTYTNSIARNGEQVKIPDFWSSFLVYIPNPSSRSVNDFKDTLNAMMPLVEYANFNFLAVPHSQCNVWDSTSSYTWNDPAFTGFQQKGVSDPQAGIAVDSAWCFEDGKPFVKVGIYDDGLDVYHEDFGGVRQLGQPVSFDSDKVGGWDFVNQTSISTPTIPIGYHGTGIAGVIGANRNNSVGIAGIAGGNEIQGNKGVKLVGMKIMETIGVNTTFAAVSDIVNAYIEGASDVPAPNFGYGLQLSTHSYGLVIDGDTSNSGYLSPNELLELNRAVYYCNRNQMGFFSSAGNFLNAVYYPSNFNSDWIICSSSSNGLGNLQRKGGGFNDPDWDPLRGKSVDLCAPGTRGLTYSTVSGGGYGYVSPSSPFYQTSFSNAYTAGVGALLKSYLDTTSSANQNLSPDDMEHILTRAAVDIELPGKDTLSGWGRLNAHNVMKYVNKECRKLKHFGIGNSSSQIFNVDSLQGLILNQFVGNNYIKIPLRLTQRHQTYAGQMIDTSLYWAYVYKIEYYGKIPVPSNHLIKDVWERSSVSNLFPKYDSISSTLEPFEKISFSFTPPNSVKLTGYSYELFDSSSSLFPTFIIGGSDSNSVNYNDARMEVSVLFEDTLAKCDSVLVLKINELENNVICSLFPNPTNDWSVLKINSDASEEIEMILADISGKVVMEKKLSVHGEHSEKIDLKNYSTGIYALSLKSKKSVTHFKIIKL